MPSISLASYVVRVRQKRHPRPLTLGSFDRRHDLLEVFREYLQYRTLNAAINEDSQRVFQLRSAIASGRELTGIISTGEWGYSSTIRNVRSGATTHRKGVDEAEILPFYYLISLPADTDEGVIIFQRLGTKGIRKLLLDDFALYFSIRYSGFVVSINPLAPGRLLDQYLGGGGRITEIRLIQFRGHTDRSDRIRLGPHREIGQDLYLEVKLKATRNNSVPIVGNIRDYFERRRPLSALVEIAGVEPDVVKLGIEVNGRQRVIDLTDQRGIRAYYDISRDVDTRAGHPVFESIDGIAHELLTDLYDKLGTEAEVETEIDDADD